MIKIRCTFYIKHRVHSQITWGVADVIFGSCSVADPGFSPGGAPTPKGAIIFQIFVKNSMKMKEFGPPGGRVSLAPPLDPPMLLW